MRCQIHETSVTSMHIRCTNRQGSALEFVSEVVLSLFLTGMTGTCIATM